MNTKKIVVAGANGNLGKLVCEALIARAEKEGQSVQVIGLTRKGTANVTDKVPFASTEQQLVIESVDYDSDEDLKRVCEGAYCVISVLLGVEDVVVAIQSRLLNAAIACNVRRFIPSDFSIDFFVLPKGSNRNFDWRLQFHELADRMVKQSQSDIEITSVFQGGFTDLLASGWVLLDYKKNNVTYFGSPDTSMDFTSRKNTAEFTAAAALDNNPTPRKLLIAGIRLTPKKAQQIANRVTGASFKLKHVMTVKMLRMVIAVMKFFNPATNNPMPLWVGMQYGYCQALGAATPRQIDNDRYLGIDWDGVEDIILEAYKKQTK